MKLYEFSRELLPISEQYMNLKKTFTSTIIDISQYDKRSHGNLIHFHLANIWKELTLEQKVKLITNSEYSAIGSVICEMNRMLLNSFCTDDYKRNALNISREVWELENNTEPIADNL